jgi:hypothetical protein
MTSVHELICKLLPFSDAILPAALAGQVLELAKQSIPKISLAEFPDVGPDTKEIEFSFDHMVSLGFFSVKILPRTESGDVDYDALDEIGPVRDVIDERMQWCTCMASMSGKDVLAFFTDELLQYLESNSILLTCDSVPLTDDQTIPIARNTDT